VDGENGGDAGEGTMKIRIEKTLADRARECAREVGTTLHDWSRRALLQWRTGKFGRVAKGAKQKNATRGNSTVVTLFGSQEEKEEMRLALLTAVKYCEKRRPRPFKTRLREGVDYIVEREEE
jgi:hypothetical protein